MVKSNNRKFAKNKLIYLDNAAATKPDKRVLRVFQKVSESNYANSGAMHESGILSAKLLHKARKDLAEIFGAHIDEIIFTSGATESNNLAIRGVVRVSKEKKPHIVTLNIEHPSVIKVCEFLEKESVADVTFVPIETNGIVNPNKIKEALQKNTVLVSVMYANNEIGTIQPVREIAKIIRAYNKKNKKNIVFHTDAVQAVNYLPVDVSKLGVDLMSFNGGKIYGLKGSGGLFIKRGTLIDKIIFGGEQEGGKRAGTANLPVAVALAEALKIADSLKEKESARLLGLRKYFLENLRSSKVLTNIGMILNGDEDKRLPNNINITIPNIPSDLLVVELSAKGICASEKSACKSEDKKPSYVISALRDKDLTSLRFSLGRETKKADLDYTVKALEEILQKLGKWYI